MPINCKKETFKFRNIAMAVRQVLAAVAKEALYKTMQTSLLIVFVRNPQLGTVKTRLAVTVGDKMALEIYMELMRHTAEMTQKVSADKKVFYSDELSEELKISKIKTFYEDSGSVNYLKQKVKEYSNKASEKISQLEIDKNKRDQILNFSRTLLNRQS